MGQELSLLCKNAAKCVCWRLHCYLNYDEIILDRSDPRCEPSHICGYLPVMP